MQTEVRWDFPVAVREVKVVDNFGNLIRNKMACVDEQTGQVLGLVGNRFHAVQNKTLYDTMESIGKGLDLHLDKVSVCRNKSLTIFKYGFGEEQTKVVKNSKSIEAGKEDKVGFGIEVFNSFDAGLPSSGVRAFAERLSCLNGMTLPRNIARFSFRSLGAFDGNSLKDAVTRRLVPILNTANTWENWATFTPNRIKLGEFISSRISNKAGVQLLQDYDNGKDRTLWGFYNLLTYYISHVAKVRAEENKPLKVWELGKAELDLYKTDLK